MCEYVIVYAIDGQAVCLMASDYHCPWTHANDGIVTSVPGLRGGLGKRNGIRTERVIGIPIK